MAQSQAYGWAIQHRHEGREWLTGRYGFEEYRQAGYIPQCIRGYVTAVFAVRRLARDWLREQKRKAAGHEWSEKYWRYTTVVKVRVDVHTDDAQEIEKYYELLDCVVSKYPDESRHQTAKKYIEERESRLPSVGADTDG